MRSQLTHFLKGELLQWSGLPEATVDDLTELIGTPLARESVLLGAYQAERLRLFSREAQRTLLAYARDERLVMIEAVPPPHFSIVTRLPEPDAVLPQEIELDDAYAHEYLYCARGLLLTLVQPFDEPHPTRLHRCRGVRSLDRPEALGPELYRSLDSDVKW